MQEFLSKLSSYNLFNYLLPGIIFSVAANKFAEYSFTQPDIISGVFIYYFIGLVISRFGSLIIEPFLKFISFLNFTDYSDFISASKDDEKLELLSEVNNTYRTLCSLFVILLLLKLYKLFEVRIPDLEKWSNTILILLLLTMFLFAYKKQTGYITGRIKASLKNNNKDV